MPKVKGLAHIFGANGETITDATITGINLEKGNDVDANVQDANGRVIETRLDGDNITGSIELRIRSGYTIPDTGDTVALTSQPDTDLNTTYEIVTVDNVARTGEYYLVTLNLRSHSEINYGAST